MTRNVDYKPPFVYFGGKSSVAQHVWDALGNVDCYVEPFFGSGAVLFLRPHGPGKVETVNDADGLLANCWRAIQKDVAAVAHHADWPVSECDLHARHLWLVGQRERITERLCGDPEFFDAKAAGWWIWGLNCWIGSGWCSGKGPWIEEGGEMVLRNTGQGVNRKLPHLGDTGKGVNRKRPRLGTFYSGGFANKQESTEARRDWLIEYLGEFAERLARVRVCCGDWSRVCGPSVTFKHGLCGVFLDPPYAETAKRTAGLYAKDCDKVAHAAREWAIENGKRPDMRIVLAGYEGEHEMPDDWRVMSWEAAGGYALQGDEDAIGRANSKKERLWFSPHCVNEETGLFAMMGETP